MIICGDRFSAVWWKAIKKRWKDNDDVDNWEDEDENGNNDSHDDGDDNNEKTMMIMRRMKMMAVYCRRSEESTDNRRVNDPRHGNVFMMSPSCEELMCGWRSHLIAEVGVQWLDFFFLLCAWLKTTRELLSALWLATYCQPTLLSTRSHIVLTEKPTFKSLWWSLGEERQEEKKGDCVHLL